MDPQTRVLLTVSPFNAVPSANIRQVRTRWVASLMQKFKTKGWRNSKPKVYAPVPFEDLKLLVERNDAESRAELAAMRFKIMDGAHRMKALRYLMSDPAETAFDLGFKIVMEVVPESRSAVQRSIDATAENATHNREFAKKTFFDDLWTMLGIRTVLIQRLIAFSNAIATPMAALNTTSLDPDAGRGRQRRQPKRTAVEFRDIPNLPEEGSKFKEAYEKYVDKHMIQSKHSNQELRHTRRPFNPVLQEDADLLKPSTILGLLGDNDSVVAGNDTLITDNSGVKCKWRVLQKILPMSTFLKPVDEEDPSTGGNGLVFEPDRDIRLWDYWCLVNDTLTSKSKDVLSYKRVYAGAFANNAYDRVFCGLMMMSQVVDRGDKIPDKAVGDIYCAVAAVFKQYDKAASVLTPYTSVEELLLPYIKLDENSLRFIVIPENDEWTCPQLFKSFTQHAYVTKTHPIHGKTHVEMDPRQKTQNDECRVLAGLFLEDISRCRLAGMVEADERQTQIEKLRADFGFFHEKADSVNEPLQDDKITEFVHNRYRGLRATRNVGRVHQVGGHTNTRAAGAAGNTRSLPDEDDVGEAPTTRLKLTQPDADIQDAKNLCINHLHSTDDVHMYCSAFENFASLPEIQALYGKVALVLTDPPYNTRRESGASNSAYDKLSPTAMTQAADTIEKLLRPFGRAFVFCSSQQTEEWRVALEKAGGGRSLVLPNTPDIILRDATAINSGGRFQYHRVNAYELAWSIYKDNPGATQASYQSTVGFGGQGVQLHSGSKLPIYCNAFDHYIPPRGVEIIRNYGRALRPEQKSVKLLQDIIQLFAPQPSDIVVDLFGGTMSTVVAALIEGRPIYACEIDPECFEIGQSRVHAFQYRRGAAGLLTSLSSDQVDLLRSNIVARARAPDKVPHEPETYGD